ncbi:MAG TPA: hydroxyethylthiazole kinase [Spirochaetia bacterium]|nr:hydroxyethylthiazole kinase [Spirochaetia bacterium]
MTTSEVHAKTFGKVAAELLERIHQRHPLIHHMTNWVVMNDTANATLALGALPVMSHAKEEVAEMVGAAGALVLNPGTLYPDLVDAMIIAGKRANERGVPVIYDPVGVGATTYRNETADRIMKELHVDVVRGNSGEVGALAGAGGIVKGVESVEGVADPAGVARDLAKRRATVVAITGKRDFISDGKRVLGIDNGHEMLKTITGTGCMATTVIAIFCAVESDRLIATAAALAAYGLAAQNAAAGVRGPGSFRAALIDCLYNLTPGDVTQGARIVDLG